MTLRLRSIAVLQLLIVCPLAAFAAQEEPRPEAQPGAYFSRYQVRYLSVHAAQSLAWEQCPQEDACQIKGLTEGRGAVLDVIAEEGLVERAVEPRGAYQLSSRPTSVTTRMRRSSSSRRALRGTGPR